MKLFIAIITAAFAQVDYEAFDLTEEEVFGSGDSELAQLADEYDSSDLSAFGRSSGFDQEFGGVIGQRSLPPGINIQDYLVNGVFQMDSFREALMVAYQAAAAAEVEEENSERYFFTTVTVPVTTTVTVPTVKTSAVQWCWKCDAMSFTDCASQGDYEPCPLGDQDCCFVEIRETKQKLQQLCTGCKHKQACEDNRAENFAVDDGTTISAHDQCKPDYRQQRVGRRGPQQSVCRQCFKTCDPNGTDPTTGHGFCFGGIQTDKTYVDIAFKTNSLQSRYPFNGHVTENDGNFAGMGIPTHAVLDPNFHADDNTLIGKINAATTAQDPEVLNVFFENQTDGKTHNSDTDGTRESNIEMTFWSLRGASKAWWRTDLKLLQQKLSNKIAAGLYATTDFV